MSAHTKEPWSIDDANGFPADVVCSDAIIARCAAVGPGVSWHNARRIVACVNACAGIPTADLERVKDDTVPVFELLMQTTKQRDDLLAALKKAEEAIREMAAECDGDYELADELLAEIDNAEPKP